MLREFISDSDGAVNIIGIFFCKPNLFRSDYTREGCLIVDEGELTKGFTRHGLQKGNHRLSLCKLFFAVQKSQLRRKYRDLVVSSLYC